MYDFDCDVDERGQACSNAGWRLWEPNRIKISRIFWSYLTIKTSNPNWKDQGQPKLAKFQLSYFAKDIFFEVWERFV